MKVFLLLADAAQVTPDGAKVHALGLGWDLTGSPTAPMALVALIQVPWNETNQQHHFVLRLRDADGHPVVVPCPTGEQGVQVEGDFEVGRAAGIPGGTTQTIKLAVQVGPIPLAPGRYEWHASIDGETGEGWSVAFTVRAGLGQGQQGS